MDEDNDFKGYSTDLGYAHSSSSLCVYSSLASIYPFRDMIVCPNFPYRVSFKDECNVKVTDRLVREVKATNGSFSSGTIRGQSNMQYYSILIYALFSCGLYISLSRDFFGKDGVEASPRQTKEEERAH